MMPDAVQPIAFCETNEQRREALANEFPTAQVVAEYTRVLEMPDVEAVLILTPIALLAPIARAALAAGKDVIMEKPIARSVAEGRELVALAREHGRRLFITEQMAYRHAENVLAEIIASGEIGDVVVWDRVQHWEADPNPGPMSYASTPWRKQADFPLGTLFDGGIHLIASLTKVFGPPTSVYAHGRKLQQEYGEYDQVAMMFEYANGTVGMLSHSDYLSSARNHYHIHGTKGVLSVESRRITIDQADQPQRVIDLPQEDSYQAMWKALAAAFKRGGDPFYTPEKALQDVAILETVDQAIKAGARLPIARFTDGASADEA
jgi:predicted dehydrogenase